MESPGDAADAQPAALQHTEYKVDLKAPSESAARADTVAVKEEPFPDSSQATHPQAAELAGQQPIQAQPVANGSLRSESHAQAGPSTSREGDLEAAGPPGAAGKQVSTGDIQRVQNYIEKCLQMYLSQKEVIQQLQQQFSIEPCFTQLVWQKLEEQNQEFFRAYYTRLKLKDQIILFNHLLDEQVKMFQRLPRGSLAAAGSSALQQRPGLGTAYGGPVGPTGTPQGHGVAALGAAPGGDAAPSGQLAPEAGQLSIADFPGMDLPPDLGAIGQSLPFSGSENNLAGLMSFGSPGRGQLAADHVDLTGLPRNFSLSDLDVEPGGGDAHGLPPNISFSDLPPFDLDSGGEQG